MKAWLLAVILLAGCASQSGKAPSAAQSDARYRAKVHTELATNYFTRAQYGVALEELNEALKADTKYVPAYYMLGLVYMELKEEDAAVGNFQRALKLAPRDPDANNNYGWYLCTRGRAAESLNYFTAALRDPLYATPQKSLVNAGVCSRTAGNEVAAEDYLRKALKIRLNEPQANYHLADIHFRRDSYQSARTHIDRVMEFPDPSAEALWLALRIERQLNNRAAEASYAMKLKRRYPDSLEARLLRAGKFE